MARRSDRGRRRPRWSRRAVVALAILGAGLPVGGAAAQVVDDPYAPFGGFNASARAGGVQLSYDVEGVLPLPPPLIEVTVPTTRSTSATGPTSVAFGSMAYPGDLVGNLPVLAEQSAPGTGALIPPYPLAVLADHPSGPASARQDIAGASATVEADDLGAQAVTTLTSTDVPGVVAVGAVTTTSRTGLEDGRIVARSRTEISSAGMLFGLIRLHDVVIDVVATTDATAAATAGTVEVGAATLLGLPITIGPDGVTLDAPEPGSGPLGPLTDAVGGLGAGLGAARDALDAGSAALADLLGPATTSLDELLAAGGVRLRLAAIDETTEGASADVLGAAIALDLAVDGSEGVLAQLLALVPSDELPGTGTPGVPVNTSPQALVNLLKEKHVARVELGPVVAGVDASPAFGPPDGEPQTLPPPASSPNPRLGTVSPAFSTPLPNLPGRTAPISSPEGGPIAGRAVAAVLGALLVLSLPAWGAGSARLMALCLDRPAAGCAGAPGRARNGGGSRARRTR